MNDRFKFRVWNKENKKLYDWDFLEKTKEDNTLFWCLHQAQNDCKHNILMQCTGLKDKNGKLIYEGDVVKEEGFYWKVVWNTDITYQWSLRKIEPNSIYPHIITFSSLLSWKKYEVIGNIYENEDLLLKECE